jgi:hypothetical protein
LVQLEVCLMNPFLSNHAILWCYRFFYLFELQALWRPVLGGYNRFHAHPFIIKL